MRKFLIGLVMLNLVVAGCAPPQNKQEQGTRVGAGAGVVGGALLGQVIGGSTKATLIGVSELKSLHKTEDWLLWIRIEDALGALPEDASASDKP